MDDYRRGGFMDAMGVIGTMLFGAVIGAVVALLMAPKSGAELREDLLGSAGKVGEQISDAGERAAGSVRSQVQRIGEKAEELGARIGAKAEEMGENAERI